MGESLLLWSLPGRQAPRASHLWKWSPLPQDFSIVQMRPHQVSQLLNLINAAFQSNVWHQTCQSRRPVPSLLGSRRTCKSLKSRNGSCPIKASPNTPFKIGSRTRSFDSLNQAHLSTFSPFSLRPSAFSRFASSVKPSTPLKNNLFL